MQPEYVALARVVVAETPSFPHLGEMFQERVSFPILNAVTRMTEQASETRVAHVPDCDAAARLLAGALLTHTLLDRRCAHRELSCECSCV